MKISDGFIIRDVNDAKVLIDKKNPQKLVKLNKTAAEILKKTEEGSDTEGIISHFCEKYGITREKSEQSVKDTLSMLIEAGVINE